MEYLVTATQGNNLFFSTLIYAETFEELKLFIREWALERYSKLQMVDIVCKKENGNSTLSYTLFT